MNLFRTPVVVLITVAMIGCAAPASRDSMSISSTERATYTTDKFLSKSISVGKVIGGEETNPAWTSEIDNESFASALKDSLETAKLLNSDSLSNYVLDAVLVEVDQPMMGFTFTVKTEVQYSLRHKDSQDIVLQQTINATGTATTGDAFMGVKRLKIANERSAQENIKRIIDVLYHYEK
ncbi:hypothetical protein ACFL3I_00450 [Pseudomonadota bacterium]